MERAMKWLVRPRQRANAEVRLICFPYAGAGAGIFADWPERLPAWLDVVAVELPGRASHFARPALVEIDAVVDELASALAGLEDLPTLFYGHSLGAKNAFELACELQRRARLCPAHLIAAARAAPHRATDQDIDPAGLDREQLIALLSRLAATPREILEHRELIDLLLPTIRADFQLNLSRSAKPPVTLHCPITALHGTTDAAVPAYRVRPWEELTTAGFEIRAIEGGHFFLNESVREVTAIVAQLAGGLRVRG